MPLQNQAHGAAMIYLSLAELELADKNTATAAQMAKEALAAFAELDVPEVSSYEGFCLLVLAGAAAGEENYSAAKEYACDALERFQDDNHFRGLGRALLVLAEVQAAAHDPAAARSADKSLEVFKFCEDEVWQASAVKNFEFLCYSC